MIFFIYTQHTKKSIEQSLGLVDYSYFFVMQKFLPVLKRLAPTIVINDIAELQAVFDADLITEEEAVLFCFAPPHRAPLELRCRVIPVFAWEYSTIPNEGWGNDNRQNWVEILARLKSAITHSRFAVNAVRHALGDEYPVASLPAPVWDDYAALASARAIDMSPWSLTIENGVVLDSFQHGSSENHLANAPSFIPQRHRVALEGIIYTTVFNPADGRKNWGDFMSAFCFAFRDNPDATLLMKLVCSDLNLACGVVWHEMKKLSPYRCRMIAIQGYLDEPSYQEIVKRTTYVINSSYGEGQCLPLMEFMSAGKPAIAPAHTAMADYICADNAFVVSSSEEWTHWPHDPRLVLRAFRYRIDWASMHAAFLESYCVASAQPDKYLRMSEHARNSLRKHCSRAVVEQGFAEFLRTTADGVEIKTGFMSAISVRFMLQWRRAKRFAARKLAQRLHRVSPSA